MSKITKTAVVATEYEIEGGVMLTDFRGDPFLATFVAVTTYVGANDDKGDLMRFTVKGYRVTKDGNRKQGVERQFQLFDAAEESLLRWLENETDEDEETDEVRAMIDDAAFYAQRLSDYCDSDDVARMEETLESRRSW